MVWESPPAMSPLTTSAAIDRTDGAPIPVCSSLLIVCCSAPSPCSISCPAAQGAKLLFWMITALAVLGVFSMLLYTFGILQFAGQAARNDTTKAIADTNPDGLLVTDAESRIVYANEAYMRLLGRPRRGGPPRPVERLFSGAPDVSEAIYRLAASGARGQARREELRMSPPLDRRGRGRLVPHSGAPARERRERGLDALDGLGRSRATASGTRTSSRSFSTRSTISITRRRAFSPPSPTARSRYMNATLAGWLDYDLAQFSAGRPQARRHRRRRRRRAARRHLRAGPAR